MAKPADSIHRLVELAAKPKANLLPELLKALGDKSSLVVAKAAALAAAKNLHEATAALMNAFERFMKNPEKTDKGCTAKLAIMDALMQLDCEDPRVFLEGVHHVQREAAWGEPIDTAANLRGNCAMALARFGHPDTLLELTTLLADREIEARRAAVQALAYLARPECELLLRLKALLGDDDAAVTSDCLSALMQFEPERSLDFVATFLDARRIEVAEGAAIALGESRQPAALDVLRKDWERNVMQERRKMLALPIALTRLDAAFDFLLEIIETGPIDLAGEGLRALQLFKGDEARRQRIREMIDKRQERQLARLYRECFEAT